MSRRTQHFRSYAKANAADTAANISLNNHKNWPKGSENPSTRPMDPDKIQRIAVQLHSRKG